MISSFAPSSRRREACDQYFARVSRHSRRDRKGERAVSIDSIVFSERIENDLNVN
jgi:hypothetical protein